MATNLQPTDDYCIAFETKDPATGKEHGGYIKAVQVSLRHIVMDSMDTARVDLTDHPLYPQLRQYVLSNLKNTRGKK